MSKNSKPVSSASEESSALIRASESGDTDLLKTLLESDNNANINTRDRYGRSLLILACEKGHEDTVQLLIARRADLNSRCLREGATALIRNASLGNATINDCLIQANADLNMQEKEGKTALMCAVEFNYVQIALSLMKAVCGNGTMGGGWTIDMNTSHCSALNCNYIKNAIFIQITLHMIITRRGQHWIFSPRVAEVRSLR